jgi:probable HAF family extracellular repeat protein
VRLGRMLMGLAAITAIAVLAGGGTTTALPVVTTTDLGTLGGTTSSAIDINSSGQVVGQSTLAGNIETHAFSWTRSGGMVDLGQAGENSAAVDVNDSGQVVVSSPGHAFVWTQAGGFVELVTPGGSPTLGGSTIEASAINENGEVVGSSDLAGDTERHAFAWTPTDKMVDLGTLGAGGGVAEGVNASGQVVGNSAGHAFVWTQAGGMVDLGTLGGDTSDAEGISDAGLVTGASALADGTARSFVWTQAGSMVEIAALGATGEVEGVTANGQVAGKNGGHAFVWTQAGGIVDLGTLGGLTSSIDEGVSQSAQAGRSSLAGGESHAFLWTQSGGMVDLGALGGTSSNAVRANAAGQVAGDIQIAEQVSHATLWEVSSSPDADNDGVVDSIDTGAGTFSDASSSPPTVGSITDAAGNTVLVEDAPAPEGVRITVTGSGSAKSVFSVCGFATLRLPPLPPPGNEVTVTCHSVEVHAISGPAEIVLAGGASVVSLPSGASAKVSDLGGGGFSVENLGAGAITVTTNGTSSIVPAGSTASVDTTPPVITAHVAGTAGTNGWYRSTVSLTWTVSDGQSTVSSTTGCAPSAVSADTTGVTRTCSARSGGGTSSQSVVIKKDSTLPTVSFAAHAASYTVDQTVTIACTASDSTSGIQTGCQSINAAAYTFPLGTNNRSTSATDRAGNSRTVSTAFAVRVTAASLCNLTRQFVHASAKYQNATVGQRAAADIVVSGACAALTTRQTALYKAVVTGLASSGWLIGTQATTLRSLADHL